MSGAAAAQILTVAASPILSRLYEPADFGLFALFVSVVSLLETVVTGRYERAIVLPDNEADAANLLALSLLFTGIVSGGTAVFIWLSGGAIAEWFGAAELTATLWFIPIYLLAAGVYNSLNFWSTRHMQFRRLSVSQVFRAGGTTGIQIALGVLRGGGLISGKVIGQTAASGVLFFQIWRDDRSRLRRLVSAARFLPLARQYRDFPRYGAPQALLNALSLSVFTFLITPAFGPVVVGYYALTQKVMGLPARLLGEAIRQVFFPKASELAQTGGDLFRFLRTTTLGLMAVGVLPALIVLLFGPQLFAFVFGDEWYQAGVYAQLLTPWTYIALANPPSVMMIPILNKQSVYMNYEILSLVCRAAVIFIGVAMGSDVVAVALYSAVGFFLNASLILYVLLLTRHRTMTTLSERSDLVLP